MPLDVVGSCPEEWYSAPIPRTCPEMIRPPLTMSSMAISSATRSGLRCSGSAFPMMPIRTPEVLAASQPAHTFGAQRSEEHTSELQSRQYLVCRLLLEKKKKKN